VGKLGNIGKDRRPLTEVELARAKRGPAMVRMVRGILKKSSSLFCQGAAAGCALLEKPCDPPVPCLRWAGLWQYL